MIRKTAAITAASIAGVIIAGGAAVGANIGILNAADDNALGDLSAAAPISTPYVEPIPSAQPVVDNVDSDGSEQSFTVDTSGTVDVDIGENGLELSEVRTNQGWAWRESGTDRNAVEITFTSGADTLVFTATRNENGTIDAGVERPTASLTQPPATNTNPTFSDHDDDEYGNEDDDHNEYEDDDEYEDHDDDEHEGHDDDD